MKSTVRETQSLRERCQEIGEQAEEGKPEEELSTRPASEAHHAEMLREWAE